MTGAKGNGRDRRLSRLFARPDRRAFILALDDAMLGGPRSILLHQNVEAELWSQHGVTGILAHPGFFRANIIPASMALIVNLAGGTYYSDPTRRSIVASVDHALALGADLVAYQIHVGSRHQSEMLADAGTIVTAAARYELPVMLIAYPRGEGPNETVDDLQILRVTSPGDYAARCAHAARIATDLGADVVKVRNPGTRAGYRVLVEACAPIPTVASGGFVPSEDAVEFSDLKQALLAGANGVAVGRRIIDSGDPLKTIAAVDRVLGAQENHNDGA